MLYNTLHNRWLRIVAAVVGELIAAAALNLFIVPLNLYAGGIMGVCQLIRTFLQTQLGVTFGAYDIAGILYFLVNVPILLFAYKSLGLGLVGLYGLNELVYRLTNLVVTNHTNLNDTTISAQIHDAPHMTLLIVIVLAPFVEEVLFRGLVFGNLKGKSRGVAYLVSCALFALLHVWQFAVVERDVTYFLLMIQYLVPGVVLAWAYEHSGTLWTSIGVHAVANALSAWTMVG